MLIVRGDIVAIFKNLEQLLLQRKMNSSMLAEMIKITKANLSVLKTNNAKLIRFSTLDSMCRTLNCQPCDIIKYVDDKDTS
jgi:putative transcriptional regulator